MHACTQWDNQIFFPLDISLIGTDIHYYATHYTGNHDPFQSLLIMAPELSDVHKLLSPHSYEWDRIGRALRVPYSYRRELESHGERICNDSRLERVLNKWIETESVPVTWDRLIEGLEEIELRDVIRSVREFLKTDKALATNSSSGIYC